MFEMLRKIYPGIHLRQQIGNIDVRHAFCDNAGQQIGARRTSFGLEGSKHELIFFASQCAVGPGQLLINGFQQLFKLNFPFSDALSAISWSMGKFTDFLALFRPALARNQIRLWIRIPTAVFYPDVAAAQTLAQYPQRAQFIVPTADLAFLIKDVSSPSRKYSVYPYPEKSTSKRIAEASIQRVNP